ncbi:Endoplasmin [Chionoecetes opilio]|uniref:Heat shock protein 83 n=1 Tax=Chionoecetes opilio TaxID=41210 RepID=A0A8J4Y935_CHIOP|nr:Endoplasmin [Chionoecetes opilio]
MLQIRYRYCFLFLALLFIGGVRAEDEAAGDFQVEGDLGAEREGSRTDDGVVAREEEAIKLDGLNVAQMKELREKAEKHVFQAEVNRMMKLIINSLYRNKEIFLRELISNASDALDKIRLLALTDKDELSTNPEMAIRIKADKDNHVLHITDTGLGMTRNDLVNNLGTIAKSGTSEFFSKLQDSESADQSSDLIGQFGVGFYSSFLVADRVVVTSKHNSDKQQIWESDSSEFSVVEDPRGDTLKRGTTVSLHLKEEAYDFVEVDTVKNLVRKYSQFINFPIYLWESKTEEVEEPLDEDEVEEAKEEDKVDEEDEEGKVEEEEEKEDKPKTKKTHFVAEGEVTFKSLLFVPEVQPGESFNKYGTRTDNIKLYVRRVFITDDFQDMMPNYLNFIRGVVDSDDLPLNVSRENLQQHKLLKVIKKKLVRKTLDMLKKLEPEAYEKFWKEYSTNLKLGTIEDSANRTRLAKLLRFFSSAGDKLVSLAEYVERMKEKQEHIYYMAGASKAEVENSPFVERLLKKGYEVLFLTEAIDEYAINAIPEFEGKKFQNVAKEGLTIEEGEGAKEHLEELKKVFEPLTKWLSEDALKDEISKAVISSRLSDSPCALVASMFGWTGNMERLAISNAHQKTQDSHRDYYLGQKKTLEINPRHPLIKELLRRVDADASDEKAKSIAEMMFHTATLRSGYMLKNTVDFSKSVEEMMRQTLGVSVDEPVEEEPEYEEADEDEQLLEDEDEEDDGGEVEEMHDEL